MILTELQQLDSTPIIEAYADSNLRSPVTPQRRAGKVFNTPGGPFPQYADDLAVSSEVIEFYWRLLTAAQEETLYQASIGAYGDELYLVSPEEIYPIKIAFVPGPEAHQPQRFKGTPPSQLRTVISRVVRLE